MRGNYAVKHTDVPLNADNSGLFFKDKLQQGNFILGLFDADGNPIMTAPGTAVSLTVNFDPDADSLEDLRDAINSHGNVTWTDVNGVQHTDPIGNFLEARIVNNQLEISGKNGYSFGLGNDTSGVLAALGLNTFFSGTNPTDVAVRDEITLNHNLINAGHLNGAGEINAGDAQVARDIAKLTDQRVIFTSWTGTKSSQSISNYYGALIANVGGITASAEFQESSATIISNELADRQSEVSGVNLDEEMSNLIKFQASYKAAAKLITTADQMLQTLLSLKQ
jgi:flagellar hook-associated protein 1 FlgK